MTPNKLSIDFRQNDCFYSIFKSTQAQITVQIYDLGQKRQLSIIINNSMLQEHSTTISQLGTDIYMSNLYENSKKRNLIQYNDHSITLQFTYPKCQTRPLTFKAEWHKIQTSQSQSILTKIQKISADFDKRLQNYCKHYQSQIDGKLANAITILNKHSDELIQRLNQQMQQKIQQFCMILNQGKVQQQQQNTIVMREAINRISDSNFRYFDEFKLIKTNLETDILTCDQSIKEISMQMKDLRNFVMAEHEKMEDQIIKTSMELKDFEEIVRFQFKEIKSILQEKLPDKVGLIRQVSGKSIDQNFTYSSMDNINTEISLLVGQNAQKEQRTTLSPILDQQSLSELPFKQQLSK